MNSTYFSRLTGMIFLSLFAVGTLSAQSTKTSYFMRTVHTRNYLNPALTADVSYVSIPALGNVYVEAKTNALKMENLLFKRNGEMVTFMHPSVSAEEFLSHLNSNNHISAGVSMDIFSIGICARRSYLTFHLGLRTEADINIPRPLFELMKSGFSQEEETYYDLSGINASAKVYVEVGGAYSRGFLNQALQVGVRPKLLFGGGDAQLEVNRLDVNAGSEKWHVAPQATLRASAPGIIPEYDEDDRLDNFDLNWEGIPGFGLGVDFGFEYHFRHLAQYVQAPVVETILSNLKLSFALNNLGFIRWNEKNNLVMRSPDEPLTITPDDYIISNEGSSAALEEILEDIQDKVEDMINLKEDPAAKSKRTTNLNKNMHIGLEYTICRQFSAGLLFSRHAGEYSSISEFTLSANYQPLQWLGLAGSYSLDSRSGNAFGAAIHLAPSYGVSFFIATDMAFPSISPQFLPAKTSRFNGQVGICIPTGRRKS